MRSSQPPGTTTSSSGIRSSVGNWTGARIVAIAFDPKTGNLLDIERQQRWQRQLGNMVNFATGWDDGTRTHGRPTDVEMSPDGRLFVADDQLGEIFWIAPVSQ